MRNSQRHRAREDNGNRDLPRGLREDMRTCNEKLEVPLLEARIAMEEARWQLGRSEGGGYRYTVRWHWLARWQRKEEHSDTSQEGGGRWVVHRPVWPPGCSPLNPGNECSAGKA